MLLSSVEELRKLAARQVRVFFAEDVPGPRSWNLRVEGPFVLLLQTIATLPVRDMEIEEPKLEDVILNYYRDGARMRAAALLFAYSLKRVRTLALTAGLLLAAFQLVLIFVAGSIQSSGGFDQLRRCCRRSHASYWARRWRLSCRSRESCAWGISSWPSWEP